ncbi:MAG: DEAD/DEAH box helicase [bacterium]|nr:DEAD/DEAH box helicase [bacterium]
MTEKHMAEAATSFYGLGIAPRLLEILDSLSFKVPTPIQHKAIPLAIEGKDVIGIAQTGTGKTLAFGVPMLQRIGQTKGKGLVVLPTRELALQVDETIQKIGRSFGVRTAVLIGGASMDQQLRMLNKNPHVIIGTPGRILDHLEHKSIDLQETKILVLDEADRMLDMGFAPQIKRILQGVSKERQTLLFSATMPNDIMRIANTYMKLPLHIEVAPSGTAAELVEQELFVVTRDQKLRLLDKLLSEYRGTVLIFSRTKFGAKKITRAVLGMKHTASEIHSNRSLAQRKDALGGFKNGKYRVLVATDIAARGIDVKDIEVVINFDIPEHAEDYVHRIGRTGRAGSKGRAITFATPEQGQEVRDIQKIIRTWIPITKLPDLPAQRPMAYIPPDAEPFRRGAPSGRPSYGNRPQGRPPFRGSRPSGPRGGSRPRKPFRPTRDSENSEKREGSAGAFWIQKTPPRDDL